MPGYEDMAKQAKAPWLKAAAMVMGSIAQARMDAKLRDGQESEGEMPCPLCDNGTVRWWFKHHRAARYQCDTPRCLEGMS